jgi:hypothetical protein
MNLAFRVVYNAMKKIFMIFHHCRYDSSWCSVSHGMGLHVFCLLLKVAPNWSCPSGTQFFLDPFGSSKVQTAPYKSKEFGWCLYCSTLNSYAIINDIYIYIDDIEWTKVIYIYKVTKCSIIGLVLDGFRGRFTRNPPWFSWGKPWNFTHGVRRLDLRSAAALRKCEPRWGDGERWEGDMALVILA